MTPNNPFRTSIWFSTFSFWLSLLLWWGITAIQALPYGAGTYGSCQYQSCSISVLSSGTVALNATPTVSGVYTFASDNVTVDTAASTGYTLTLKDSDTTTSLQNGADTITATSGTPASPITLAINTWGWRIDGLGNFGAGPTTAQNNINSSALTFAGVVASNQAPQNLQITNSAANPPETTEIWYGVRVDNTKKSGEYTNQVVYTAVAND